MIERFKHDKLAWLDIVHPTADDVREIYQSCDLPTEFSHDLTSMNPRSEVISTKGALKMTLDFPVVKRNDINHPHEIKFIVTKQTFISIRFEDITAVDRFQKEFEVYSLLKNAGSKATGAHFFFALLHKLYSGLDEKLDYLESKIAEAEQNIFNDNEKQMLFELSSISRRIITFRHTLLNHQKPLEELRYGAEQSFGKNYVSYVDELQDLFQHLLRRTASLTGTLDDLRDTNSALLSSKQNEVMKILTIMAFITFPLTLFTSLFGMNTTTTPLTGHPHDFWIIVGVMTVISLGFFGYFKHKNWI